VDLVGGQQVIVVGAGPSGLALAIELGSRSIRCLVVERNVRAGWAPRAKTTHSRTRSRAPSMSPFLTRMTDMRSRAFRAAGTMRLHGPRQPASISEWSRPSKAALVHMAFWHQSGGE
jgi:2-polyprenyl-6-methoxyphenol hydroxylase-like FAD-dependent oxidoreductase